MTQKVFEEFHGKTSGQGKHAEQKEKINKFNLETAGHHILIEVEFLNDFSFFKIYILYSKE